MSVSGTLPAAGERIDCGDWCFEVIDLDGKRIDKVMAAPQRYQERAGEPAQSAGNG
jgi:putative hemolysin